MTVSARPSSSPDDLGELARATGLRRVGTRPPLGTYLWQAWVRRDFIATMAIYRLRSQVEENRLGVVWFVLRPILDAAIYGVIFGYLQGDKKPPDYVAYVVTGTFLFQFFRTCFQDGAQSIVTSRSLVQSLAFPRLTLPISRVVEELIALVPALVLLPIILLILGHHPSANWLLLIPLVALFAVFNAGVALVAARLTVHLRDVGQLIPYLARILFYTSGVLFDVNIILRDHAVIREIYNYHPIYQVLCIARGVMMGTAYPTHYWVALAVWAVLLFAAGLVFFWWAEERYGTE